jgi:O-antigen/teichoic acid export membrane protein
LDIVPITSDSDESPIGRINTSSRASRLTRGTLAGFLGQVINAAGTIVLVPLFLKYWGKQSYGEWLTLAATVAYVSATDFGIQPYVVNRLNQSYSRGAMEEYTKTLHSALLWSLAICSAVMVLASLALAVMPIEKWFDFALTSHRTAAIVAALLAFQFVATQFVAVLPQCLIIGIYSSIGEYPRGAMVRNLQRLMFFSLTAGAVAGGAGMIGVAAIQLAPLASTVAYVWWDMARRHPEIRFGWGKSDLTLALSFLGPGIFFLLIQLAPVLALQGSTLIVGATLGAASVVSFVTLRTLANALRQLMNVSQISLWPELTSLEAEGRRDSLRTVIQLNAKILLAGSLYAAFFLHFQGRQIIQLWTRGRIVYDGHLMDAFLVLLVAQTTWISCSTLLMASNNHRLLALSYISSVTAGLALAYPLSRLYGPVGIVFGLLAADVSILGWLIPLSTCRISGQNFRDFFWQVNLRGALVGLLLYGCMRGLLSFGFQQTVAQMVAFAALTVTAGLSLAYAVWLDADERERLILVFRQSMNGRWAF